jgi:hypothetical protein
MRIEQMEYWDQDTGWRLAPTDFFPDLTLLVGISGVGKTKILKAIRTLRRIVRQGDAPSSDWGVAWRIRFVNSGQRYTWEGEYEGRPDEGDEAGTGTADMRVRTSEEDAISTGPKILRERLCAGEDTIIDRDNGTIYFKKEKTPKLSPYKSALALLKEEDSIKPVVDGFGHIAYLDQTVPQIGEVYPRLESFCKRYPTLKDIQEGDLPTYINSTASNLIYPN